MDERQKTGSAVLGTLLDGGIEPGILTTLYGPSGSGKTVLGQEAVIDQTLKGKKVIYIDTEESFSVERLSQLTPQYKEVLDNIIFLRPSTFEEQKKAIGELSKVVPKQSIGLIVVDTIAMLYRFEFSRVDMQELNRALGEQLSGLSILARKNRIPVLIMNQVYADIENNATRMVGGEILRYASKCLIELRKFKGGRRSAIVMKHRSLPEGKTLFFEIQEKEIKVAE